MTTYAVTACVLVLAVCLPATCKGQYYWGANGWRQYWQPSSSGVCDRAYPARQTGGYVLSCRYYCSGLPVRYSFEQDGTPCYTDRRIAGTCYAGRCQRGWWPVQPPAAPQAPATVAPEPAAEGSALENQGWSWPSEDADSQRCTRADPNVATVRRSCRYLCKGWPIRSEEEADGTACQLSWWREGFCFRGHCQRNYPLPPVPSEEDNKIEGGIVPVRKLKCRNYKGRVKFNGVVRSCVFVCKQKKKAFVAYEENGTPCAALPGQSGFCDQGVCKAIETPAAPTEAAQAPTEHETEGMVAVVSPVTNATPLAAVTPTAQDAIAVETEEAVTAASSGSEQEPETAAPAVRLPWAPGFIGVQCDRAYPPKVVAGRVLKCRFVCRGYPFLRIGFEEDDTPCLIKKTIEGVCFNGKCKPLPLSTDAATPIDEPTTVQSRVTEADAVITSGVEETGTDVHPSTDDAKASSTTVTVTESEGSHATSASERGAFTAADIDQISAATDRSSTGAEGELADATPASASGASDAADIESTSASTDNSGTGIEGKVTAATSASESGASTAADVDQTSAATDRSSTGAEGELADATPASASGASDAADIESTSASTDKSGTGIEGEVTAATSASESGASTAADIDQPSAAAESSRTGATEAQGEVSEATSASERGVPGTADVEQASTDSENDRTDTEGEVSEATSAIESEASATRDIQGTSSPTDSEAQEGSSTKTALAAAGEASQSVDLTETASTRERAETSTIVSSSGATEQEVTAEGQATGIEQPAGTAVVGETGTAKETVEASSENEFFTTEAQAGVAEFSTKSATAQQDLQSTVKTSSSDEAEATGAPTDNHDQAEVTASASHPVESSGDSSTQNAAEETTDRSAGGDELADQASSDGEGKHTIVPSFSDVTSAPSATTEEFSDDTALNADDSVSESAADSGVEVEHTVSASATVGASSDESTAATAAGKVIVESTEKSVVTAPEDLASNAVEVTTTARSGATEESPKDDSPAESVTQVKESEKKESTESLFADVTVTVSSAEERTTNQAALTTVENAPAGEVAAETVFTTNEGPANEPAEGEATTASRSSTIPETQQDVVQGLEASSPGAATEGATAADESATVKVITTITRKEIFRPVDPDASQPDATLVQETSGTSDAPTAVESPTPAAVKVGAESVLPTTEGQAIQTDEGDTTTPALSSAAVDAQQIVIQGTEALFPAGATEGTTSADESATVKVITTITRKEIVRPVDADESQPDATVVQKSSSTSVETLPVSGLNKTAGSSPVVADTGSPSETGIVAGADVASADAVSSGPSLVITDFVQKTAASSKDPATTPSVQQESTAAAESGIEVNANV